VVAVSSVGPGAATGSAPRPLPRQDGVQRRTFGASGGFHGLPTGNCAQWLLLRTATISGRDSRSGVAVWTQRFRGAA
jgi:hypothetical protein